MASINGTNNVADTPRNGDTSRRTTTTREDSSSSRTFTANQRVTNDSLNEMNKTLSRILSRISSFGTSLGDKIEEAVEAGPDENLFGEVKGAIGDAADELASSPVLAAINKVLEGIRGTLGFISDTVQKGIDTSIANQKSYLGPISARLQSFDTNSATAYKDLSYEIRNVFTNSRYINQQQMLQNLNQLVEAGIGYNLEDRAYLATIADRTAKTFDILNPALLRMERLQQADLSRPQMGLESYLTKGLNSVFQDTSYLNSMYDSVTAGLLEATSQMAFDETTSYLYNVQKWLGSLYSVGMSESAIQTIVQGLNYLGSGNVSQLTGNDQLNTLFAMSAQRAGLSYAQLLTTGVSDENVDKLLRSMIEYLQSIAENTSSEVLRNEYGRVFGGLSVSDIRAIQNLTSTDIAYIDAYKLNYEDAFGEVTNQIKLLNERTSTAEQIENMFNNLVYSIGSQIAENEEVYRNWVYANIAEQLGDTVGGLVPVIGDLVGNTIGVTAEVMKAGEIMNAIKYGYTDKNGEQVSRPLEMFKDYVFDEMIDEAVQKDLDAYNNYKNSDDFWNGFMLGPATSAQLTSAVYKLRASDINTVKQGIANWDPYSRAGLTDPLMFGNWQQGTARLNNYSSSIALAENAFAESESKIKAASEEITGVDDTVSQSLDNLYDSLFGVDSRPIKVMVVDIDGNLLGSTTTNEFASNFDIENSGARMIETLLPGVRGIE